MDTLKIACLLFVIGFFCCCGSPSANRMEDNEVMQIVELIEVGEKRFPLDSLTCPGPKYIQLVNGENYYLTFLNTFNSSIYFYDFDAMTYEFQVNLQKEGPNAVGKPMAYHVLSKDSIMVFNALKNELLLLNQAGLLLKKISLIGGHDSGNPDWALQYPQYAPSTSSPFIETSHSLLFPGMYPWAIPDSIIDVFKFTTVIDLEEFSVLQVHTYPAELYGAPNRWDDPVYTTVYACLNADGDKVVYSFPVSSDVYVSFINDDTYGISKAGRKKRTPIVSSEKEAGQQIREEMFMHMLSTDLYGAIKYDPYRKVYYRLMQVGIEYPTTQSEWLDKEVLVIVLDEEFNYLGERAIGVLREWHWENLFVSKEGLHIEYLSQSRKDEDFLIFKVFVPNDLHEN